MEGGCCGDVGVGRGWRDMHRVCREKGGSAVSYSACMPSLSANSINSKLPPKCPLLCRELAEQGLRVAALLKAIPAALLPTLSRLPTAAAAAVPATGGLAAASESTAAAAGARDQTWSQLADAGGSAGGVAGGVMLYALRVTSQVLDLLEAHLVPGLCTQVGWG